MHKFLKLDALKAKLDSYGPLDSHISLRLTGGRWGSQRIESAV